MFCERVMIPQRDGVQVPLDCYCAEVTEQIDPDVRRPAVLILGGGGYRYISHRETEPIALDFIARGYNAFVCWYRVEPDRFPKALWDAAAALAWIRVNAERTHTAPGRVAVLGFSAGGHLAASLGTMWQDAAVFKDSGLQAEAIRPDALVLCYPVIVADKDAHRGSFECLTGTTDVAAHAAYSLEKKVTDKTPPTFLWHTWQDDSVPVQNTLRFALALAEAGVAAEVHCYPRGGHGAALARPETSGVTHPLMTIEEAQGWPRLARRFLTQIWDK